MVLCPAAYAHPIAFIFIRHLDEESVQEEIAVPAFRERVPTKATVPQPTTSGPSYASPSRRTPQPFSWGRITRPCSMWTPVATSLASRRAPSMST